MKTKTVPVITFHELQRDEDVHIDISGIVVEGCVIPLLERSRLYSGESLSIRNGAGTLFVTKEEEAEDQQ